MTTLLMCPPRYFDIEYEINPWMRLSNRVKPAAAQRQWGELHQALTAELGVTVELLEPVQGLPDLVFTANAGFINGRTFISSNFKHPERARETPYYDDWFANHGYVVRKMPEACPFEGAGDALALGDTVVAGYRYRSDICSHTELTQLAGRSVLSVELVNPQFYHLDTCFCPLGDDAAMYYPPAFDTYANQVIEANVRDPIVVNDAEASRFACNAVVAGSTVVLNTGCPELEEQLQARGYATRAVDLSEFMKSGGSAKCLTLALD